MRKNEERKIENGKHSCRVLQRKFVIKMLMVINFYIFSKGLFFDQNYFKGKQHKRHV